ncbi:hypothetical protein CsatB_024470 [Cannabis sativa]
MANVHTKFTPTPPHFFKIILQKTLHHNKIQIPKTFWVKHCGSLSSQVFLKLPCGSTWEVGLTKTSDGKIWIENGWDKFAQHCSLSWGNFLVFRYEENSLFHVIIFDKTTTEIDYSHFEKRNVDIDEDEDSIEVLDNFSPIPCSSSRPHKKMKTSTDYVMKWDLSDKVCGESSLPRWMKPEIFLSRQMLDAKDRAEAVKRAKGFQSKDPFFMVYMQPSFVGAKYNMVIPMLFAKYYLLSSSSNCQDVILKVQDGRTWSAKYYVRLDRGSPKARLEHGWKEFAIHNDLKVGDICAFVLRKSIGVMLFEVVTFSGNGVVNSPLLPELNAMTKGSRSSKIESHKIMNTKRPSFTVTMREAYATGHCNLFLPYKFVKEYLNRKECEVRLWVADGRCWFVQLKVRQANGLPRAELCRGWIAFARENNLRTGDVCKFELSVNNGNEVSILVSIVKGANVVDDAFNKIAAIKRKGTTPSKLKRNPHVKVESSFTHQKLNIKKGHEKTKVELSALPKGSGLKQTTVLERGSSSQSERPSFTVIMHETYATGRCYFVLPYKFVEKYIKKKECEVRLWLPDGRCWFVQLKVRQANEYSRAELCRGWREFALDNSLQAGDICKFELTIEDGDEVSFKVSIDKDYDYDDAYNKKVANKRKAITPSKLKRNPYVKVESSFAHHNMNIKKEQVEIKVEPNISDMSMKLKSDNQGRTSKAASKFFSKNPHFQVVLRSNHVYGYQLPFPRKFARQYLEGKAQDMSLWVGEKYWVVKLLLYTSKCEFGAGWAAFAVENTLMPKDVCIFELINNNQAEMKVHIFRESGLAQD